MTPETLEIQANARHPELVVASGSAVIVITLYPMDGERQLCMVGLKRGDNCPDAVAEQARFLMDAVQVSAPHTPSTFVAGKN